MDQTCIVIVRKENRAYTQNRDRSYLLGRDASCQILNQLNTRISELNSKKLHERMTVTCLQRNQREEVSCLVKLGNSSVFLIIQEIITQGRC